MKTLNVLLSVFTGVLLLVVLLTGAQDVVAGPSAVLTPESAFQAAETLRLVQVTGGHADGWRTAMPGDAQPLNDLRGIVTAYLFPLTGDGKAAGYIIITTLAEDEVGAAEYAVAGESPLEDGLERARMSSAAAGVELVAETPVYFGPLDIAYEVSPLSLNERRFLDVRSGEIHNLSSARQADLERQRAHLQSAPKQRMNAPQQEHSYQRIDGGTCIYPVQHRRRLLKWLHAYLRCPGDGLLGSFFRVLQPDRWR